MCKTWRHLQNRKYITYRNAVRRGPSQGDRQHAQKKLVEARPCGFHVMRADRQADRQTDRQRNRQTVHTHHRTLHSFRWEVNIYELFTVHSHHISVVIEKEPFRDAYLLLDWLWKLKRAYTYIVLYGTQRPLAISIILRDAQSGKSKEPWINYINDTRLGDLQLVNIATASCDDCDNRLRVSSWLDWLAVCVLFG